MQGDAAGCRRHLVTALHHAVRNGAHPLHFRCQEGYCLLVSACRSIAGPSGDGGSIAAAAAYALASAAAADALVAAGESETSAHKPIHAARELRSRGRTMLRLRTGWLVSYPLVTNQIIVGSRMPCRSGKLGLQALQSRVTI